MSWGQNRTFLVTGATGNIGSRIVRKLIALGIRPRVFARDPGKAHDRFGDKVEVYVGEFADTAALARAVVGVDALMLISGGSDLARHDQAAAAAARAENVGLIVKLSSQDAEDRIGTGVWHADGEAAIREAGTPFVFVRPSGFMDNALHWAPSIKSDGLVRSSTGDGALALIHPDDIADVAVAALGGGQADRCLTITGPKALTFGQMTSMIGAALGRMLRYEACSDAVVRQQLIAINAPEAMIDARLSTMKAIREGLYTEVSDVVQNALGRPPIDFEAWVAENKAAFV